MMGVLVVRRKISMQYALSEEAQEERVGVKQDRILEYVLPAPWNCLME